MFNKFRQSTGNDEKIDCFKIVLKKVKSAILLKSDLKLLKACICWYFEYSILFKTTVFSLESIASPGLIYIHGLGSLYLQLELLDTIICLNSTLA